MKHELKKLLKWPLSYMAKEYGNSGVYLPYMRSNQGLQDDRDYLLSAINETETIHASFHSLDGASVLDFGCGQGRLAQGMILNEYHVSYLGIDTDVHAIRWCKRYISNPKYLFMYLPAYNERYNTSVAGRHHLPRDKDYDVIIANSVFTHMLEDDIRFYLSEFHKVLSSAGIVYLTAFTRRPQQQAYVINPDGFKTKSDTPLHRVVYESEYFRSLLLNAGFHLRFGARYIERTEQRIYVLQKQ